MEPLETDARLRAPLLRVIVPPCSGACGRHVLVSEWMCFSGRWASISCLTCFWPPGRVCPMYSTRGLGLSLSGFKHSGTLPMFEAVIGITELQIKRTHVCS